MSKKGKGEGEMAGGRKKRRMDKAEKMRERE